MDGEMSQTEYVERTIGRYTIKKIMEIDGIGEATLLGYVVYGPGADGVRAYRLLEDAIAHAEEMERIRKRKSMDMGR